MHFVISGKLNCPQYVYAVMIAQKLKENLPNFEYTKIPKKPEDWGKWLLKTCKENDWHHIHSPLIWKEVAMKRGKKYLVGDLNKFLDLCSDYYGIPKEALSAENFEKGELNWFQKQSEAQYFENIKLDTKKVVDYRCRQICITGASSPMTSILIMELLHISTQSGKNGMEIRLYDEARRERKLHNIARDAKSCSGPSGLGSCRVANDLREAVIKADLVIVLDNFNRKSRESLTKWLKRNRNAMCALGKALNKYAQTHCRVILAGYCNQPLCYNATVLASFATKLHVRNIVAVTQDLGRELLPRISEMTEIPLKDLYSPPVWGFIGLNKYVDIKNTLHNFHYKVPGPRLKSTLPQGKEEVELRTLEYLIKDHKMKNFYTSHAMQRAESLPRLGRVPCLGKATSIINLLRLWSLGPEDGTGEILCLGVYSDGTFNIPKGIYWSQPVTLEKGFWVPFPDFPVPRNPDINLHNLFLFSVASLYRTRVKPRFYTPPNPVLKTKSVKKFDFEEIKKGIKVPVVKNEGECLDYLKKIAKEELGLDFGKEDEAIEELPEPEEPPRPKLKIWCECWKEQLKELQEEVFRKPTDSSKETRFSSSSFSSSMYSIIIRDEQRTDSESTFKISQYLHPETSEHDFSAPQYNILNLLGPEGYPYSRSSSATVCSCESDCKCLNKGKPETEDSSIGTISFEKGIGAIRSDECVHEAELAMLDKKSYPYNQRVTFDPNSKIYEEKEKSPVKFYGQKDAIQNPSVSFKLQKRIKKYERGGEDSLSDIGEIEEDDATAKDKYWLEEEEEMGEEEESLSQDEVIETKFHLSFQGAPYEILGDPDGLQYLEGLRRSTTAKPSVESFKEFYSDTVRPSLQILSTDTETRSSMGSTSTSDNLIMEQPPRPASKERSFERSSTKGVRFSSEKTDESIPGEYGTAQAYFEEYGESLSDIIFSDTETAEEETEIKESRTEETIETQKDIKIKEEEKVKKKPKWEGVPKCFLCRCIIQEGLLGCPCGETTVVEVFKKESEEVIVESDDEISFKVEYLEEPVKPSPMKEKKEGEEEPEEEPPAEGPKERDIFNLPPESFLPFRLRRESKFHPPERPQELKKSDPEPDLYDIPPECHELLRTAEDEYLEKKAQEENLRIEEEQKEEASKTEELSTISEETDDISEIKTQFSDLKMLTPDEVDDWQISVRARYQKWFLEGTPIKNELYYDIAIEEASDDEFETDENLEKYFEK